MPAGLLSVSVPEPVAVPVQAPNSGLYDQHRCCPRFFPSPSTYANAGIVIIRPSIFTPRRLCLCLQHHSTAFQSAEANMASTA